MMSMDSTDRDMETAVVHHQAGRLAEAESLCERILAIQPDRGDALSLQSIIALQAGKPDLAIQSLEKILNIDPDSAEALHNLGSAFMAKGRVNEARSSLMARLSSRCPARRRSITIWETLCRPPGVCAESNRRLSKGRCTWPG